MDLTLPSCITVILVLTASDPLFGQDRQRQRQRYPRERMPHWRRRHCSFPRVHLRTSNRTFASACANRSCVLRLVYALNGSDCPCPYQAVTLAVPGRATLSIVLNMNRNSPICLVCVRYCMCWRLIRAGSRKLPNGVCQATASHAVGTRSEAADCRTCKSVRGSGQVRDASTICRGRQHPETVASGPAQHPTAGRSWAIRAEHILHEPTVWRDAFRHSGSGRNADADVRFPGFRKPQRLANARVSSIAI